MMEEFLPSEIARAVYGYLLSEGCEDAANSFLESSPSLIECKQRVKHGKRLTHANTLLLGKGLAEVLNIACSVHSIVKQIHDKQQRGVATDGHESLTELLDQLRLCVFSDTRAEENSFSQPSSQPDSHCLVSSPHCLRTPPTIAVSLADNYRSLVQECSEGLDLSLSPEKTLQKNKNVESPCRQLLNRPTSAPGALELSQLEMDNESAVAAITGITGVGTTPVAASAASNVPQVVTISSSLLPTTAAPSIPSSCAVSSVVVSSTVVTAAAVSTVTSTSHQTSGHMLPATLQNNHPVSADALPDPPIIVLNSQNQSFEGGDMSAAYFNVPPCASSTPQPSSAFMPEDTAFILYPPLTTDPKPKKVPLKEKTNLRRSGRLRKLLPKPTRKDPPHIIHIKVLPQTIDEDNEEDTDEANEIELAKELPNSEEKKIPEGECEKCSEDTVKEDEMEIEKNVEVVGTTSDKENVSDENTLKGESLEKSTNNLATECDIETSTPRPPPLRKNISRSTPRRNSHVRALSFNTPHKAAIMRKSNTSPKMPRIKFSPRSTKLSCVKRSSLFSPKNDKELSHLSEEEDDTVINHAEEEQQEIYKERSQTILENSPLYKVPIATRSPAPRLSSAWQEVNDIKITEKPVWDEQIRSFALGDFEDPAPPPKKGPQDNQSNLDTSPNKVNKNSPKKENNQFPRCEVQNSCPRKTSRLKKSSYTPVKRLIINKKVDKIEPLEILQKKKTTSVRSSRSKTTINKKKSSQKKTNHRQSVLNSKEKPTDTIAESAANQGCQQLIKGPQVNAEDKSEVVSDVPTSVKHQAEGTEKVDHNNILLEDLVVSSNSCFPHTSDDGRMESNLVKESSQIFDGNKNETCMNSNITERINKTSISNSPSPTFVQPSVMVLETPSKEFQVCDPKMFALTTPSVKLISKEISILEEDLLLTPSLPPTPQVNSSPRNLIKTPCKTFIGSPNLNKAQALPVVFKGNESNFNQNKITKLSPSREKVGVTSLEEKDYMLSKNSESEIDDYKDVKNSLSTTQTHPMTEGKIIHRSIQSIGRPSLTTTTDTSEDENDSHANGSDNALSKSKITFNEKNKKNKVLNVTRNRIYSTTESSDDESNSIKIVSNNGSTKTKLSKLASVLLENERNSLNQKSRKTANKKSKISIKKRVQHSPESVSPINSTKGTNKSTKKKDTKHSVTVGKLSKAVKKKSPKINLDNKEAAEKQVTPENVRQQLQSDLLKRERKMIFGDGFPSTSDSESDMDIFEKKNRVATKTKLKKSLQKKKTLDHIVLSEDSSMDNLNKDCLKNANCVRFKTFTGTSSKSPNTKQDLLLTRDPKIYPINQAEEIKCQLNNVNNPPTVSSSSELLENVGQDKTIDVETNVSPANNPGISVISNLTHEGNPKQGEKSTTVIKTLNESRSNGQNASTSNCNVLDKGENNQSDKNSEDKSLKQSHALPGLESNVYFKNIISTNCSADRQVRETATKADYLLNETVFIETKLNNTADCVQEKDIKNGTKISMDSCNSIRLENHNSRSPTGRINSQNKREEIEEKFPQKDHSKSENEICITSTSSYKNMNTTSILDQLDLDRRDTFQVDEGNVVLSYSQIIEHHYYSPVLSGEFVQVENTESVQSTFVKKNDVADKTFTCREQAVKKRIKLIPIEHDKYEQKLQVDYDFIDEDNCIVNRGNRRLSNEIDILDCSTSSILSSDTGCMKKQSLNFISNPRDSHERKQEILNKNQESTLDTVKNLQNEQNTGKNEINKKLKCFDLKEIKSNHSEKIQEKLLSDKRKYKKYGEDKEMRHETINGSRSRIHRSHRSWHENERNVLFGGGRNKSRHKNELPSPPGRKRERDEDSRYDRSYHRRDCRRRHSERWRRESDRRGFSERRIYSSHSSFRRGYSPDPQTSRHDPKRHYKTSVTDHDAKNIVQLKETLSKIEKIDLDRVDKLEKSTIGKFINQDKVDPRAAQVLTYSDVERNDSSRDETDSLMDFAVISKTKDNRMPEHLPKAPSGSSLSAHQDLSNNSKRKAPTDIDESPEACHVEKKLKLGEVEMKEAKSVLKHKMADMLNALHPDTSNEAT